MTPTPTPASPPSPPKVPTGREIFDAIMAHFEPELTSEGRKTLAQKYTNESPTDREARRKRYALAMERYEQAYQGYIDTLHEQVGRYRKESFRYLEAEDQTNDGNLLDRLSQTMLNAA